MYLLLILLGPVVWGIAGLVRGRMQISAKRELHQPHLAWYAWMLILGPIAFTVLSVLGYLLAISVMGWPADDAARILMFSVFIWVLVLACILSRAKRHSVPIAVFKSDTAIQIDEREVRSTGPDFSSIDE